MAIKYKFGTFSDEQMTATKKKLHSSIFWLLLYKDPETASKYPNVDLDEYFKRVMQNIGGLDELFGHPAEFVELQTCLQSAQNELRREDFEWKEYRRLVLKAENIVDKLSPVVPADDTTDNGKKDV